jgi:hypothetical protein
MFEAGTRAHQIISEKIMLDRLAQSDQMREFFIQMWRQNPVLVKQAGTKVQNLMTQLDRGDTEEKSWHLSDAERACWLSPNAGEPSDVSKDES